MKLHLKRTQMPTLWHSKRKNINFIAKPNPGSHKRDLIVSFLNLLKDELKFANSSKEAKFITNNSDILVNGKKVNDIKFPIGVFDVIEFKDISKKYIVILDKLRKISLIETNEDLTYLKLTSKTLLKKGKYQMNFSNGYNIFTDKTTPKNTKIGDTIIYDFKTKKIVEVQSLKKGIFAYIFAGKFKGYFCEIEEIVNFNGLSVDKIEIVVNNKKHSTAKKYCLAIGSQKECIQKFLKKGDENEK